MLRILIRRSLIVTLHHMVSDDSPSHIRQIYPHKSVAAFESDLDYLQSNHEVVAYAEYNRIQPSRSPKIFLSFDDGLREHFDIIRPILIRRKLPAIFFVTTDWIDNSTLGPRHSQSLFIDTWLNATEEKRQAAIDSIKQVYSNPTITTSTLLAHIESELRASREVPWSKLLNALEISDQQYLQDACPYLTREQISEMAAEGFIIGAHSKSHRKFSSINDQKEWIDEVTASCNKIAEISGQRDVPFAFPHSGAKVPLPFMQQMQSDFDHVGMFFDTNGIASNTPIVIGRVTLDRPDSNSSQNASTAKRQLNISYRTEARRALKRSLRRWAWQR